MIGIIDYGAGNLQSVYKALKFIGSDCKIVDSREELFKCDGAILPGVGSFRDAMDCMAKSRLVEAVKDYAESGKPFLGICLGLHLLFSESEESPGAQGLSLLGGSITKIPSNNGTLKIPHMGWNSISIKKRDGIFKGIPDESYVYFVHSYYLTADDGSIVAATTNYGTKIDAAVEYGNIIATQFHPEKSGSVGLKMLENFAAMTNTNL